MAIYPAAVWRGNCRNHSGRRTAATRGLVLHVNDGPNVSLWSWVNRPSSNMSCHFQVLQNGIVEQYLDTELWSWCQADGNNAWLSMEMPSYPDSGMTSAQLVAGARVLAWAGRLYGFPLQLTSDVDGRGLGWHGMGGDRWGGHPGCPGDIRIAQRAQLLALAVGGGTPQEEDDMPAYTQWADKDRQALASDVATAIVNRGMGGVGFDGSLAELLIGILGQAKGAAEAVGDRRAGALVRIAQLQADLARLPAAIAARVGALPAGGSLDVHALAKAVVAELGAELSTGTHAA